MRPRTPKSSSAHRDLSGGAGVLAAAIASARDANLLRADHFLHLRCEIPMPSVVEEAKELVGRPDVRLVTLNVWL